MEWDGGGWDSIDDVGWMGKDKWGGMDEMGWITQGGWDGMNAL